MLGFSQQNSAERSEPAQDQDLGYGRDQDQQDVPDSVQEDIPVIQTQESRKFFSGFFPPRHGT